MRLNGLDVTINNPRRKKGDVIQRPHSSDKYYASEIHLHVREKNYDSLYLFFVTYSFDESKRSRINLFDLSEEERIPNWRIRTPFCFDSPLKGQSYYRTVCIDYKSTLHLAHVLTFDSNGTRADYPLPLDGFSLPQRIVNSFGPTPQRPALTKETPFLRPSRSFYKPEVD